MKYGVCLESKHKSKVLAAAGGYDLLVIDAQDFTGGEITHLKAGGKTKILSYINVGAIEDDRSYFSAAKKDGLLLGKYDNWPGEYWVAAQKSEWKAIILGLASSLAAKGVDGFWVDNLDILYTAEDEYQWSKDQLTALYTNLQAILAGLHKMGYVMINGGDVFVTRALKKKQCGGFDAVNQETVITSIVDYDPPGKFSRQSTDEREYFQEYLQQVKMAEKDIFLLEYATAPAIITEAEQYARSNGYTLCVSHNIELGGDLTVTAQINGRATVWDVAKAIARFDGSETAHADTVAVLRKKGHKVSMSDAWCTEQLMAILYEAGAMDLLGKYHQISDDVKKEAEKHGIWHAGMDGIKPFYPVIFGEKGNPNHSEISVGHNINVSGNYNGGTARRKWKGRHVMGYIKLKYAPMPDMDDLQVAVVSSDVILGVYGTKATREAQLSVFGAANAAKIQAEVNRVWGHDDLIIFNMAAATIAGFMGKGSYRKKRLGKWEAKVQAKINQIYSLRGRSTAAAADLVRSGAFGKGAVRTLLLGFCGYDALTVHNAANKAAQKDREAEDKPAEDHTASDKKYRLYAPRFWDNDPEKYGDASCFIEYAEDGKSISHAVLVDTGMDGTDTIKKLQGAGVKALDALIISHDHSDHFGLTKKIIAKFGVVHVYLPPQEGVRKYQSSYAKRMDDLAEYCRSHGVPATFYKVGDTITAGTMRFECIFQADAGKLPEKDSHHFINNMSAVIRATCGAWTTLLGGDLSADGIRQMLAAGVNVICDIVKILWHGDRLAIIIKPPFAEKMGMKVAYSQYHNKEGKGNGRKLTYDILRKAGAFVVRSYEDGEIYIDMQDNTMTVTTSKGIKKIFKK